MHAIDFHAHHSPLGAYATFTCGRFAAGGGMTIEGARPVNHNLVIGYADADDTMHALPFFTGAAVDLSNFAIEQKNDKLQRRTMLDGLTREYRCGTDAWRCGDFSFTIHSPVWPLPDPDSAGEAALQRVILPVVCATLRLDNRRGSEAKRLIFAITPGIQSRLLPTLAGGVGVGLGRDFAVAAPHQAGVVAWQHWNEGTFLRERRSFALGRTAGLQLTVPAGQIGELPIVMAFHRSEPVTTGIESRFYYTRAFPTVESVVESGLSRHHEFTARAAEMDRQLASTALNEHQQFLVAHAQRSYWGNSQLVASQGRPLWIVLEGEYAMINTFDLTVDMAFYELRRNPWTLRNVLDQFVDRYSYVDRLARPAPEAMGLSHAETAKGAPPPVEQGLPGGISFSHDMGVGGHFTPPGDSCYECPRLTGCFSYMTGEQLLNWILCAASYVMHTDDRGWLERRAMVFNACLESLLNRDDPTPAKRTGIITLDSSRCEGGWEITTYDSLDPSLGQARSNLYMATKAWSAWLGLMEVFAVLGDHARAEEAWSGAKRAAATIVGRFDKSLGYIPAVFEGKNSSAIIPAIEALVYPLFWNKRAHLATNGAFAELMRMLGVHLRAVLKPGLCLFPDHGWKLSSTSDNSWMSKIFICEYVAKEVFGVASSIEAHAAHAQWQQVGSKDWAMTDQCIKGVGSASRYYPRCVTADLWM